MQLTPDADETGRPQSNTKEMRTGQVGPVGRPHLQRPLSPPVLSAVEQMAKGTGQTWLTNFAMRSGTNASDLMLSATRGGPGGLS